MGSSITKGINTRHLKDDVHVDTNRGGTVLSIKQHLQSYDLSPFSNIILQFCGNDAGNKIPIPQFRDTYKSLLVALKEEDESKRLIVGGLVPRENIDMSEYNDCLMKLCDEIDIEFISHLDSLFLKNGKMVQGLLYQPAIHLTKSGTSVLLENMNDVLQILNQERSNLSTDYQS